MPFSPFVRSSRRPEVRLLRVGVFTGFAPFAWRDLGQNWAGRDIAFLRRFAARESLRIEFVESRFDRLWESPARGTVDLAASGLSRRPGLTGIAWSRPYAEVRRSLLVRRQDHRRIRKMADLAGSRMAAVAGSAAATHAKKELPASARLTPCDTLETGIADLIAGRVDALGTGSLSAEHHARKHPNLAIVDVHACAAREHIAFALPQPSPLLARLNDFILRHAHLY